VLLASARTGSGIAEVWEAVEAHRAALEASGERQKRRREQARAWMWSLVEEGLHEAFRSHPAVADRLPKLQAEVERLETTPAAAARALLRAFREG
jgi:LAO/AO transport system kinase